MYRVLTPLCSKDLVEEVRNVVKEEMTNMKEIKAELKVERAVKRPYSPLPSGARIREPESLRVHF